MTEEEILLSMRLIQIDSPCVLLVDANKIDIEALSSKCFPRLDKTVLIVSVDGAPDVVKLDIAALRKALAILEAA